MNSDEEEGSEDTVLTDAAASTLSYFTAATVTLRITSELHSSSPC
jgi:hypothetical protein